MSCPGILVSKRDTLSSEEVLSASCLLPPSDTHCLPSSLSPPRPQTVSTASELRKPIYWIVAAKAIDYEQMLLLMAGVKWDIREIMSQHNVYVDVLLKVILLRGGGVLSEQLRGWIHVLSISSQQLFLAALKCQPRLGGLILALLSIQRRYK